MSAPQHSNRSIVRVTTSDLRSLLPALIRHGASVHVTRCGLDVRGLSAEQVARVAATHLAPVTDLETVTA